MLNVVLYQPEIPPNTGNVIRLCANTGAKLHLIQPLGFDIDDKQLRRAGLDYHEYAQLAVHSDLDSCLIGIGSTRVFAATTRGATRYDQAHFQAGDTILFGPETRGLPLEVLGRWSKDRWLYLPMRPENRSLNLSNTVAVVVYEAWRQLGFAGAVR